MFGSSAEGAAPYQPGATPQDKRPGMETEGCRPDPSHQRNGAGFQPSLSTYVSEPGALPQAGIDRAFGPDACGLVRFQIGLLIGQNPQSYVWGTARARPEVYSTALQQLMPVSTEAEFAMLHVSAVPYEGNALDFQKSPLMQACFSGKQDFSSGAEHAMPGKTL